MRKTTNLKPVVFFGCVHIGADTADLKLAKKYVDFARRTNAHVLLLGDNFEAAIPSKKHMTLTQNMTAQQQYEFGLKLFAPIAKQVVGACTSNHSERIWKETGVDLDKVMAERLGYLDKYCPTQGLASVVVGLNEYKIAYTHGNNAGVDVFRDCRGLHKKYPSFDIHASSHSHRLSTLQEGFWDVKGGKRKQHNVTYVVTGSSLDYPDYADRAGYSPQPKGFAVAWLNPNERHVTVDVSGQI